MAPFTKKGTLLVPRQVRERTYDLLSFYLLEDLLEVS